MIKAPSLQTRVAVVIVTYNSAEVVATALRSLPEDVSVIVVDNASQDDTLAVVRDITPAARLIQNTQNLGFARAVNTAVRSAESEYILLLNPDAQIDAHDLAELVCVLDAGSDIGVASPHVREGVTDLVTMAGGYAPTIWKMLTHATGLSRFAGAVPALRGHYLLRGHASAREVQDLDWVSGGCMIVRREVWTALNGLTERWFMYAEDVEFCLRARGLGWKVVMVPWAHARHIVGASSPDQEEIRTLWLENLFDLYQFHYAAGTLRRTLWRSVVAAGYAARSVAVALIPGSEARDGRRFRRYARAAALARRQSAEVDEPLKQRDRRRR